MSSAMAFVNTGVSRWIILRLCERAELRDPSQRPGANDCRFRGVTIGRLESIAAAAGKGYSTREYYDSAHPGSKEMSHLRLLWAYRHLVWELVVRDIKVRYKRSVLGIVWTMLSPLLNMIVLTLVFSTILKQSIANYAIFFMTGQIYWSFFASATGYAAAQTDDANEIAKRIFVPRSVFVVSSVGVALVNLVLSMVPLGAILLVLRFPFHPTWWFVPISILLAIGFSTGVGFLIFTLASRFSDVREMYMVILNTLFFLTPIVYAPAIVPRKYRIVLWFNPHFYLIHTFRDPIYEGRLPSGYILLISVAVSVGALAVGWVYFCRNVNEFAFKN